MKPETCLITGAAGFIGSHLAERLMRDGHFVIGVDCFADYYPRWYKERNLAKLRGQSHFAFIEGDLLQIDLVALLRGRLAGIGGPPDRVFHLAAQAGVRDSWGRNFDIYTRNNVLATQRLLEAAKEAAPRQIVYASSSSVYGDAEAFPTAEDVKPAPVSPYGLTKLATEHLARLYWRSFGVPVVGLRYFTVYGPRQRPDMAFHKFIRAMLEGEEIEVYGDGEQTRDFTYVDDAVEGTVRAAFAGITGEVFNLGGGSRVTVKHVLALLESITGKQARVRYSAPGRGDVRHTSADIGRAAEALSYEPHTTLADGLRAETNWLSDLPRERAVGK